MGVHAKPPVLVCTKSTSAVVKCCSNVGGSTVVYVEVDYDKKNVEGTVHVALSRMESGTVNCQLFIFDLSLVRK